MQQKLAVVSGASSGLGLALVHLLLVSGVKVVALARTIQEIELPESVIKIPLDIRNFKSIDKAFSVIDALNTKIDILVNCAGVGLIKNLENTSRAEIENVLGVNLAGNIYLAQEVYKRMIPNKSGHIINVSSTSGVKIKDDEPIYVASKWGLRGFTESLRLAAAKHTIRVTGVYPGGMKTNFWKNQTGRDTSKFMNPREVAQTILDIINTPITIAPSEVVLERGFN